MSNTRPFPRIIAGLLLLNIVGTVMIWLQITKPAEAPTSTIVSIPAQQIDSITRVETGLGETPDLTVRTSPDIEPVATGSTVPEKSPADQLPTEIVIARVNDTDIGQTLLISYLNRLASPEQLAQWDTLDDVPQNVLIQSVNNAALDEMLVQLAKEIKLDQDPIIQTDIAQSNRNILKAAYLSRLAPELVRRKDIETQYEILVASLEGKLEYRARHILLANEREARIVDKALVEKKKTFDELARLFSLDEATSLRGGDLGYVLTGQLNPEFEKVVNDLEIGQRSKPFEIELGWHIVVLDDRRDSQAMSLAQATPVIREKLERQAMQKYLADLLDSATIEILIATDATAANLSAIETYSVE